MNIITTFETRRQKKQWDFERQVLRKLSVSTIRETIQQHFPAVFRETKTGNSFLVDACVDFAIDAYLLGAEFSRFGYFGEAEGTVRERCKQEYEEIIFYLHEQLVSWQLIEKKDSIFPLCEQYIHHWWEKGFAEGEKRYRLKLN